MKNKYSKQTLIHFTFLQQTYKQLKINKLKLLQSATKMLHL